MAAKSTAPPASEQTFESAMERLERIVEEMESDKLPLENLLKRYEEGVKLVRVCEEKLKSAEQRIEIIDPHVATQCAEGRATQVGILLLELLTFGWA